MQAAFSFFTSPPTNEVVCCVVAAYLYFYISVPAVTMNPDHLKLNDKKQSVVLLPTAAGTTATSTGTIRSEKLPSSVHVVHNRKGGFSTFGENGLINGLCCVGDGLQTGLGGVAGGMERGLSEHGKGVAAGLSEHGKHTAIGMGFLACALVVSAVINKKL